jgi:RNA polymerase sigma-70 factor (ECF subfamily)
MFPANKPRLVLSASDAAKLEDIWKNHAQPVRSMLLAFCSNPEDADDALQELFLRLGRNPSVLENTKSPRAFLAVSARRIAIDHARKRASELRHSESPEAVEMLHPDASSAAPGDDLGAKILEALQSLPAEQRRVAESKLLHGKTLDAIAREEGVPLNTAASRFRYSLDKIRAQLRPIYKAMKNQPTSANSASDSTTRLIRPLEPKRVPSVVPGLEGVAACAFEDSQEIPELPVEIPQSENETAEEPILIVCPPCVFPPPAVELELPENTDFSGDEDISIFLPPENSDDSQETDPIEDPSDENTFNPDEVIQTLFKEENSESTDDASGTELGDLVDCVILPVESEEESIDPTAEVEIQPFDPAEFNDYLLREYENFLSENPDWITENSGGDMHAQVITPSQYTDLELADPGAARAFDLWFEKTYLSYSESDPTHGDTPGVVDGGADNSGWHDGDASESGTLLLGGDSHDHGTEINLVKTGEEGIPQSWWRGATTTVLDGGGHIAYNSGTGFLNTEVLSLNKEPVMSLGGTNQVALNGGAINHDAGAGTLQTESLTLDKNQAPVLGEQHQTVVTGGELAMNQPVEGKFVVEQGAKMTVGDQAYGEGSYEISAEGQIAALPAAADTTAQEEAAVQAAAKSGIPAVEVSNSPVTPIVSGSNSVLESPAAERVTFNGESQPDQQDIELPTLIETRNDSSSAEPASTDDIAFIDDAPVSAIQNSEPASGVVAPAAAAQQNIAAAVGGAFVAGSATQVPTGRGTVAKKGAIG